MEFIVKILQKSSDNLFVLFNATALLVLAWYCLSRRRWFFAIGLLGAFAIVIFLYKGIADWGIALGGDSFIEAGNFDIAEAVFWMHTLLTSLPFMVAPPKTILLICTESLVLSVIFFLLFRNREILVNASALIILITHMASIYYGYSAFNLAQQGVRALKNSFIQPSGKFQRTEDIDLLVYIGESTSTLNMSLYGYPLKTTPKLDALQLYAPGFIRFDEVRSTHTHTAPSLLRALALPATSSKDSKLWGAGQILKAAGITAKLYSGQTLQGSFATSSRYIFDGMIYPPPSSEDRYKGNMIQPKLKDHQLLDIALKESGVVFFHSYAGHGDYLDNIEIQRSEPVPRPAIQIEGMVGSKFSALLHGEILHDISNYDRAITYIDQNVAQAISAIRDRKKPAVFIYFSDHGESVYTRRGHDSSVYIDEMTTVPFVIYFNDAYIKLYPEMVKRYRRAATQTYFRQLDQLLPTILDVLLITSDHPLETPSMADAKFHPRPYIVERETIAGPSRIDLTIKDSKLLSFSSFNGGTPEPTWTAVINKTFGKRNNICYHRSNSYAKALRAASVAGCIEFDLVVEGQMLSVYHPPLSSTGLHLEHIFSIAEARKNSLWIDGKNIDDPVACERLVDYLTINKKRVGQILIEFPWTSFNKVTQLSGCTKRLLSQGFRTSYYIPTHLAVSCLENKTKNGTECNQLEEHMQLAMDSGMFSDLSFDFHLYPVMRDIAGLDKFRLNTWAINAAQFSNFPRELFDFIIMDTSTDPNTY